jgi:hypothetical protein
VAWKSTQLLPKSLFPSIFAVQLHKYSQIWIPNVIKRMPTVNRLGARSGTRSDTVLIEDLSRIQKQTTMATAVVL